VDADREVERLRLGERLGFLGTLDLRLGALAARRAFLRDTDREVLGVRLGALGVFAFLLALRDTDLLAAERFLAALGTLALRDRLILLLLLLFFDFFFAARGALARRLVDFDRDLLVLAETDALGALGTLAALLFLRDTERLADLFAALGALALRLVDLRDLLLLLLVLAEGDFFGAFGTFAARFFLRETDRLAERFAALGAFARRLVERFFFDADLLADLLVLGERFGALGTFAARRFLRDTDFVADLLAAFGAFALRLVDLERDLLLDRDLLVLGDLFGALGTFAARLFLRDTDRLADRLAALGALARRLRDLLLLLLALLLMLLLVLGDRLGALGTFAARFFLRDTERLAERFLAARGALARRLVDLDRDFEVLGDRLGAFGTLVARRLAARRLPAERFLAALGVLDRRRDTDRDVDALLALFLAALGALARRLAERDLLSFLALLTAILPFLF